MLRVQPASVPIKPLTCLEVQRPHALVLRDRQAGERAVKEAAGARHKLLAQHELQVPAGEKGGWEGK